MKVVLPYRNIYSLKDQAKSDKANKFIGRGSASSSTEAYRKAWGKLANCGKYTATDVIFVSVEGNRTGRKSLNIYEVCKAVEAKATFITDNSRNRNRSYNVGEREIADFLTSSNYSEVESGVWRSS